MKKNKMKRIIILVLVITILAILGVFVYTKFLKDKIFKNLGNEVVTEEQNNSPIVVEKKTVQIFKGNDRPIAVMIDNHKAALPQAGLNKAYMIYEIIVEGGESRIMALFKGADLEKIGPIRSSRHYFLDYALENDAIYVHYGWSPQAQSDIKSLGVNNINGITQSSKDFWRVKDKSSPHNAVTSTSNILKMAESKDYRTTSNVSSVLKYVVDEVNLENGVKADTITIPYSYSNNVKWMYKEDTKTYQRYSKNIKQVDWDTKEEFTAKNIIIEFIANSTLDDGENKGRQTMTTTGTKDGYYITNGKAIKITCTKNSRSSKTVYKDLDGKEIEVNDGNTFVQICPINADVKIEANEVKNEETSNTSKEAK